VCEGYKSNLVREAPGWNDGILEYWNIGFGPSAHKSYGSERTMGYWIVPSFFGISFYKLIRRRRTLNIQSFEDSEKFLREITEEYRS